MARVVVIDDYQAYAEMAAAPLRAAGHEVLLMVQPIDVEALLAFKPDVISVGLYRQEIAFERPIQDFERDVLGYKPIRQLEHQPAVWSVPIALVGSALHERDVPTSLRYDLFLVFPRDIERYADRIEALAGLDKRRRLSGHTCPNPDCDARLAEVGDAGVDLYCPRCGTGVTLDGRQWHYRLPDADRTVTAPLPEALEVPRRGSHGV